MTQAICAACGLPLEITVEMVGQEMACPRCGARFVVPGVAPGPAPPPMIRSEPQSPPNAPVIRGRVERRPFEDQATSLLDLFDLSFTRYVTPIIVRITWVLALVLAAVWLLVVIVGLVISLVPEMSREAQSDGAATAQSERTTSDRRPDNGAFEFQSSPQFEFRRPSIPERAEDSSFAVAMRVVVFSTQLVAIILFLLWVRVALEAVIVIFHMAANLRSIDKKTK
jgi:DNA-directed RNA polymerase subunit RPC12/RpoP